MTVIGLSCSCIALGSGTTKVVMEVNYVSEPENCQEVAFSIQYT